LAAELRSAPARVQSSFRRPFNSFSPS
jgi:hypothetical protein